MGAHPHADLARPDRPLLRPVLHRRASTRASTSRAAPSSRCKSTRGDRRRRRHPRARSTASGSATSRSRASASAADVLIRVAAQPGGEAAQQAVVDQGPAPPSARPTTTIAASRWSARASPASWRGPARSRCCSPSPASWPTSGSASNGSSASAAVATLVHDAILTIGFFAADPDRLQPLEHRGDPDHHRLLAQRHGRHLRPHPRDPAQVQADAGARHHRPRHQPDAGAHDHDVADAGAGAASRSSSSAAR